MGNCPKMVVLSVLRSAPRGCTMLRAPFSRICLQPGTVQTLKEASVRNMGHGRSMKPFPTRYEWTLFKDHAHFYVMLGLLPLAVLITYTNVTHKRPEIREVTEDHGPKHWEYFRHPITRWMAKWFYHSPEKNYEIRLHP